MCNLYSSYTTIGDFAVLDPKEVTVTLAKPRVGIEPLERKAAKM